MPRTPIEPAKSRVDEPLVLELLGQPRIRAGRAIELPTRKALALVAYVAVQGPITRMHAAALLWSDRDDGVARRSLRQELHRINATAVGPWIEARGDEIVLRPGTDVDVDRLRRAAASANDAEVLAIYRGPLLAGVDPKGATGFGAWLAVERENLGNLWRTSLAREAAARERAGDVAGAVALARTLVDDDPLDERCHRDLIRLLYGAGDRRAAIAQFERCRDLLRRELGVAPADETLAWLRRLESAEDISVPSGNDAAAPTLQPPLIGRESAWVRLDALGRGLALVTGDPGLGKSRLLAEFARSHGRALVLEGREISRDTPYYPVAEALWLAYRDDTRWFELLDPVWQAEVARLVPALSGDEANAPLPLAETKGRFLEGLAIALLTAAGDGSLVFDDLHWFDSASAELVAHLVRRAQRTRLLAAAREHDLAANVAVQSALGAIEHDGLLTRIALEPLTETDVLKLVRALSGSTSAAVFSRRLHAATAGNPLFIMESLRDLFSAGVLWRDGGTWSTPYDDDTEDYRELPISRSVREAVLRRVDRLGGVVRRVLAAASLAGDGFDISRIAACAELDEWAVADALDVAMAAHLIAPGVKGYRFAHELIRRSLADAMTAERRRLTHRRLAAALAGIGGTPGAVAQHLEAGDRAHEAISARVQAAEAAAHMHALRESITHYEAAIADGAHGADAFRIHCACVDLFRNLGDEAGRTRALEAMATLAGGSDDPTLDADLAIKRTVQAFEHERYEDALAIAQAARESLRGRIDQVTDAALLLEIGATYTAMRRLDDAKACLATAIERFRGVSPLKVANCAYWLARCAIDQGDLDAAQAYGDEARQMTERVGYRRGHALTLSTLAELAQRRGDADRARALLEEAVREARTIGSVPLLQGFVAELIAHCRERGDEATVTHWQRKLDTAGDSRAR
ncbi:MAG: AAA family ATPase [Burkholderiales bacterium]|nr:AAA family ATPase [Burkholderiales bacterium]